MKRWTYKFELSAIVSSLISALMVVSACTGDDVSSLEPTTDAGPDHAAAGGSDAGDAKAEASGGGGTGTGGSAGNTGGSGGTGGGTGGVVVNDASTDVSADGTTSDGSAEASVDAQAEAEAAAPLTISTFQRTMAVAFCDRISECCQLGTDQFDKDRCVTTISAGFGPDRVFTYVRVYTGVDGGGLPSSVFFDPTQAAACVSLQRNRGCASEDGTEKENLYASCLNVLQGTSLAGATCRTSQECRSGLYCKPGEGGPNTCAALNTSGQPCDDPNRISDQCTYLGIHSATSLHCTSFGATGGTCVAGLAVGVACRSDQECASGVCSLLNATCVTAQPNYPGPISCNGFLKASDAGADGG